MITPDIAYDREIQSVFNLLALKYWYCGSFFIKQFKRGLFADQFKIAVQKRFISAYCGSFSGSRILEKPFYIRRYNVATESPVLSRTFNSIKRFRYLFVVVLDFLNILSAV